MSRKVIIAAPEVLHTFFSQQFDDWDCQVPCTSIADLWEGRETGKLSDESSIIVLCDALYEDDPDAFAEVAAEFAPHALVLVLSYNRNLQDEISSDIYAQHANIEYRKHHGKNVPFEFIWHETAVISIDDAISFYENEAKAVEDFRAKEVEVKSIQVETGTSNRYASNKNGKVITVTSSKGGSGKSTVAICLGIAMTKASQKAHERGLVEEPLRVCVVDLDTFDGQLGFVLNQSRPTSLNIALANTPIDDDLIWNNLVYNERMGFHALLAPVRGVTARYTDGDFYIDVISHLKKMFDVVILDTSVQHYDEIIKRVALPLADAILLVSTLDIKSVKGLARWMNEAAETKERGGHGLNMDKVGVIVNGSIHGVGIGNPELTAAAMGAPLLVSIPMDTKAVQLAGNSGRLEDIVLEHPTIGPAYYKLAKRFAKTLDTTLVPIIEDENDAPAQINPSRDRANTNRPKNGTTVSPTAKPQERKSSFWGRKR